MALGTIIALFIVSLIILIISLVYASRASTSLQAVSNYSNDMNLAAASRYLVWISVVGWLSVIFMIGAIIASVEYDAESAAVYIAFFLTLVLIIAVGVIAAIASYKIGSSARYPATNTNGNVQPLPTQDDTNLRNAYSFAVISAASALGSLIFAILAFVVLRVEEKKAYISSIVTKTNTTSAPAIQTIQTIQTTPGISPPIQPPVKGGVYYIPVQMG